MSTRDSDFVKSIFIANTHSVLLVFTTAGKVFPLNVYEVPESGRNAKGRPIVNLVSMPPGEEILVWSRFNPKMDGSLVMTSRTYCSSLARVW